MNIRCKRLPKPNKSSQDVIMNTLVRMNPQGIGRSSLYANSHNTVMAVVLQEPFVLLNICLKLMMPGICSGCNQAMHALLKGHGVVA